MKLRMTIITILAMISLSGCSRVEMLNFEYKTEIMQSQEMIYSIVEALNNDDSVALSNLFSINAKRNTKSLDDDIEYLMKVYEGELVSFDKVSGSSNERNNYGIKEITTSNTYSVETDLNTYIFSFTIKRNDNNEDDNGLFQLEIVKQEDDQLLLWILHNDTPGILVGNQLEAKDYVAGLLRGIETPVPSRVIDIFSENAQDENKSLLEDIETVGEQFKGNVNFDELNDLRILSTEEVDGVTYEQVIYDLTTYTTDDIKLMDYSILLTYIPYKDEVEKGGLYSVYIVEGNIDNVKLPNKVEPGIFYISGET